MLHDAHAELIQPLQGAEPPMSHVVLPRGRLAWHVYGDLDAPIPVLVLGDLKCPASRDPALARLARALGPRFSVLAWHYFGQGASDAPEGPYDAPFFVEQALALLSELGLSGRPFVALGRGFGTSVALHLATACPERIAALILSGGGPDHPAAPQSVRWLARLGPAAARALHRRTVLHELRRSFADPESQAALIDRLATLDTLDHEGGPQARAWATTIEHFDSDPGEALDAVGQLGLPTLLLWGQADRNHPMAEGEALLSRLPGASLTALSGGLGDLWHRHARIEEVAITLSGFLHTMCRGRL